MSPMFKRSSAWKLAPISSCTAERLSEEIGEMPVRLTGEGMVSDSNVRSPDPAAPDLFREVARPRELPAASTATTFDLRKVIPENNAREREESIARTAPETGSAMVRHRNWSVYAGRRRTRFVDYRALFKYLQGGIDHAGRSSRL